MLHGGELLGAGPGDGEKEGGVADGFDVVAERGGQGEKVADAERVRFSVDRDTKLAFENLDGEGAVGVMLFHARGMLHGEENDTEVVRLEQGAGVVAGGPGLLLFGVIDLFEEIELCEFIGHGAVCKRGRHFLEPSLWEEVYA